MPGSRAKGAASAWADVMIAVVTVTEADFVAQALAIIVTIPVAVAGLFAVGIRLTLRVGRGVARG